MMENTWAAVTAVIMNEFEELGVWDIGFLNNVSGVPFSDDEPVVRTTVSTIVEGEIEVAVFSFGTVVRILEAINEEGTCGIPEELYQKDEAKCRGACNDCIYWEPF